MQAAQAPATPSARRAGRREGPVHYPSTSPIRRWDFLSGLGRTPSDCSSQMGSRTVSGPVLAAEDAWLKLLRLGVEPPHDTEVSVQVGHVSTLTLCITPERGRLAR